VRLAAILGIAASTISTVLTRAGIPRLADVDRLTDELLCGRRHSDRRYQHDHPGDLLHVEVRKLSRIPAGGGSRLHGRREELAAAAAWAGTMCTSPSTSKPGWRLPRGAALRAHDHLH
jgi:hypothetical protein